MTAINASMILRQIDANLVDYHLAALIVSSACKTALLSM